jgi:hypothetical protein
MSIEKKRRNNTATTGMMLRAEMDRTRPRNKSTKAPARTHHRRLASQTTPRFSHGSRGYPSRGTSRRPIQTDALPTIATVPPSPSARG